MCYILPMFRRMHSKTLTSILILGIALVGALGLLSITFATHTGQLSCPASLVSSGECPFIGGSNGNTDHHLSILKYVSHGLSTVNILLVLSIILLFGAFSVLSKKNKALNTHSDFSIYRIENRFDFIPKPKFLKWLNLHNKLDPYALAWVHGKT